VVGVALGKHFTLAVIDAGAVFSFGEGTTGLLGHGSLQGEVLPRRMEVLVQTGQRFIAVAAGDEHALALAEGGELYGWGHENANGHGPQELDGGEADANDGLAHYERTPQRLAALVGERVTLVGAGLCSSWAVTEKDERFTWGDGHPDCYHFGHGVGTPQVTPKRVEGLAGVRIGAVAIGERHTLAADEDGVVWALGKRLALCLDAATPEDVQGVTTPTPIPTLRVRAFMSF